MPDFTPSASGITPPPVLSGTELYDSIMGDIEPELLSANLSLLKETYANETPDERAVRAARYEVAYAEYDVRFAKNCEDWNEQLHAYKRHALQNVESRVQIQEAAELSSIETSLTED